MRYETIVMIFNNKSIEVYTQNIIYLKSSKSFAYLSYHWRSLNERVLVAVGQIPKAF